MKWQTENPWHQLAQSMRYFKQALAMCWMFGIGVALSIVGAPVEASSLCDPRLRAEALPAGISSEGQWRRLFDRDGICIWSRSTYSDQIKEVAAAAKIDASPDELARLIMECELVSRVFRDVSDCRALRTTTQNVWMFQQLRVPWPAQPRYFTVKLTRQTAANGTSEVSWTLADQSAYTRVGRGVAVAHNTGRWRFRDGGDSTSGSFALYYLAVDPGGTVALPNWLVDFGHQKAVPNMFRDMRGAFR